MARLQQRQRRRPHSLRRNCDGNLHSHSDGDCDCNGHINADGDSNSDIYSHGNCHNNGNGNRYSYSHSNGERITAAVTDTTASSDTGAETVRLWIVR